MATGNTAFFEFVEAVAGLPCLRGGAERGTVVQMLPPGIAAAVRQDERPRIYAFHLVRACLDRPEGLRELLEVLQLVEGDSATLSRVRELAEALPSRRAKR